MDRRERIQGRPIVAQQAALRGLQATIWTALPGIVQSWDSTKLTVSVQPAIQAQVRDQAGAMSWVTLPICADVPIQYPFGGGFGFTFPLEAGDEGIVIFSSRCIDAWWQQGGVQSQAELRMHNLSDGMFVPGVFSQPRVLENVSENSCQVRTEDGTIYVEVSAAGIKLKGNVEVTGTLTTKAINATGTVAVTGAITATTDITAGLGGANQIGLRTHKHTSFGTPTTVPIPGT